MLVALNNREDQEWTQTKPDFIPDGHHSLLKMVIECSLLTLLADQLSVFTKYSVIPEQLNHVN